MTKFNSGDKVRIVANHAYGIKFDRFIGTEHIIDFLDRDGDIRLVDREYENQHWRPEELELIEEAKETVVKAKEFEVGDEVKVIMLDTDEDDGQYVNTLGKTGKLLKDDESSLPYKVYFKDIDDYFWYRVGQLEPAKKPNEPMTPEEIIKAIIDGTKKMRVVTWSPKVYVVFDNGFKYNEVGACDINAWIRQDWEELIEPPKFQPKQFVANSDGTIGIIVSDEGITKNGRRYSVKFNANRDKIASVLESELSEVNP